MGGLAQARTARLRTAQVLVVASAGNSAADDCSVRYDPIRTPDKLLVGSTTQTGELSWFSNYGACVHVQVPPSRGRWSLLPRPRSRIRARLPGLPVCPLPRQ
jgi:hypothetical protein